MCEAAPFIDPNRGPAKEYVPAVTAVESLPRKASPAERVSAANQGLLQYQAERAAAILRNFDQQAGRTAVVETTQYTR